MMERKIFMDTNIWLDFYRINDGINLLDDLDISNVLITKQNIDEIIRNRGSLIDDLFTLEKNNYNHLKNRILLPNSEKEEYYKLIDQFNAIREEIIKKEKELKKTTRDNDKLLEKIEKIPQKNVICHDFEKILKKAEIRNKLGNVPKSPGKNTICDEYIWELLLNDNNNNYDLFFVSGDATFLKHSEILSAEYLKTTGKKITIFGKLKEALQAFNLTKSKEIGEISEKSISDKVIEEGTKNALDTLNLLNETLIKSISVNLITYVNEIMKKDMQNIMFPLFSHMDEISKRSLSNIIANPMLMHLQKTVAEKEIKDKSNENKHN